MIVVEGRSPYTPNFGAVPEVLAGREELLERHVAGLLGGPGNSLFTHALLGDRGVGKTVVLTVLGERMAGHGWAVLPYQARRERDAIRELLSLLPDALRSSWPARVLRGLEREVTVELNAAVVKVTGRLTGRGPDAGDLTSALRRALRQVGERAAKRGTGLLVTVDEAQAVPLAALSDLGMIIQTVAHGARLPIAFTFAGTPELGEVLLSSGSFLERMPRTELGTLTGDEARLALIAPANARGVVWSSAAVDLAADAAAGYPYFVQLAGESAWQAATGREMIDVGAAQAGVRAIAERAEQMFRDRWKRLGPAQQRYLAAAALLATRTPGGAVATGEVAQLLVKHPTQLSRVRAALIAEHHLLRAGDYGYVEFALPRFGIWLAEQLSPPDGSPARPEFGRYLPSAADQPSTAQNLASSQRPASDPSG